MLDYFPKPYNDELIYSLLSRYVIHTGTLSWKKALDKLYGNRGISATVDIPIHIESLSKRTGLQSNLILNKMSLYPVFRVFTSIEKNRETLKVIRSGACNSIYTKMGICASKIKRPNYLRYCPVCYQNDIKLFGESYWRRNFQLPGILSCDLHQVYLNSSNATYVPENKHSFIAPMDEVCNNLSIYRVVNISYAKNFQRINELYRQLLDINYNPMGMIKTYQAYRYYLSIKGYLKGLKVIDYDIFYKDFIEFYGLDFLNKLNLPIDRNSNSCWIKTVLRKPRKFSHPLFHVVLINFLQKDLLGPDFKEFYNSYKKKFIVTGRKENYKICSDKKLLNSKRRQWTILNDSIKPKSQKEVRRIAPALYIWLYRHDKKWLRNNSVHMKRKKFEDNRVNWEKRDIKLMSEIEKHFTFLKNQSSSYKRITRSMFGKKLNCRSLLEKKLDKLLVTRQYLDDICESVEEYQIRRIKNTVKLLKHKNIHVKTWKIYRKAAIRPNMNPMIDNFIMSVVKESK